MASIKIVKARIPENDVQANDFIKKIGGIDRDIERIKAERDDAVNDIIEKANRRISRLQERKEALNKGSDIYAERNRRRLTQGTKRKTVVFPNGEYQWRWGNWSVSCKNEEAAIKWFEENDLGDDFVEVKKKLVKKNMTSANNRKLAEKCPHISIDRDEVFRVRFYSHETNEE